jgi:hypothetical protein
VDGPSAKEHNTRAVGRFPISALIRMATEAVRRKRKKLIQGKSSLTLTGLLMEGVDYKGLKENCVS